ncbi:S-layer homology domain-containing protein [Scytonema sp. UIC 10036]|uniref:S-layer homology domain-containing protein n=1 Tax=Scytonema sp. UIC 10036 TaxID=2304196 RepID=UPI0012DAE963|nr:S-layer homology domain-containing protein [Scytonema sp. UIC 10036]MUG93246.1 S-layer homology domain-containing protein [Scytonema sp. UIC 10036]
MNGLLRLFLPLISLPTLCLLLLSEVPKETYAQNSVQPIFPDVKPDYWAQPFIQGLAEKNIVAGYPDGTFRPEQSVNRDELAAMIEKAFNQPPVRQISSGAAYKDVPEGYWAAPAIEDAYEQGFMTGYPGGVFRPNQNVSKVDAIAALSKVVNPTSTNAQTTSSSVATAPATTQQARKPTRKFALLPLAMTSLMQPLLIAKANAASVAPAQQIGTGEEAKTSDRSANANRPDSFAIKDLYRDAGEIPQDKVDEIAKATRANIVVNYPELNVLNPRKTLSRGEMSALVYQTMVAQGRMEQIPINTPAYQYIVRPENR